MVTPTDKLSHPSVKAALRAAGYRQTARVWMPPEGMDTIRGLSEKFKVEIDAIRDRVWEEIHGTPRSFHQEKCRKEKGVKNRPANSGADPREDLEAAWAAFEKAQKL